MSNELAKIEPIVPSGLNRYAYEPGSAEDAFRVAGWIIKSGFYPSLKTPEACFAILAQGRERGLSAFQALAAYDIIEGRLAMKAQAIAAVVIASGKAVYFRPREQPTAKSATWITQRIGSPCADTFTFTFDMAKARGLTGRKNWQSMPDVMLSWRACAALARSVYPDVCLGIYTPDEVLDMGRGVDVEPVALRAEVVASEPVVPPVEPPPARTAESSELRRQLAAIQAEAVAALGDAEARRRWLEAVGSTRGVQDPAALSAAIERATALRDSIRPAPAPEPAGSTGIEAAYREIASRLGMTDEALAHWTIEQCGGTWDVLDDEGRTRAVEGLRAELEIGGEP